MIPDAHVARALAARQDPSEISLIVRTCGEMKGDRAAPVHADGTSWIDLAGPADRDAAFDHARAFVHYADQATAPIWQRMRDACVALATEMGGRGIAPHDPHEVGSTWHDSGTLFMGEDPANSVTDTSGRFHHIANAGVADGAALVLDRITRRLPFLERIFADAGYRRKAAVDEAGGVEHGARDHCAEKRTRGHPQLGE